MPRTARLVGVGMPHHVTQRGNYKQEVFSTPEEYRRYCYWAQEYALEHQIDILAFCLMTNHVHFVLVPHTEEGMARFFSVLHMKYSQYKNTVQKKKGHLWQGRFYSCVLDEFHLLYAIRYVEQNPVRAGMVTRPQEYKWSSVLQRMGQEKYPILKICQEEMIFSLAGGREEWMRFFSQKNEEMELEIRNKTKKGLVLGQQCFIEQMEQQWGVSLKTPKIGRPFKNK